MQRVALKVRADRCERVLDRLLPLLARGVHERGAGRWRELVAFGEEDELPSTATLMAAAGRALRELSRSEVPDAWDERRKLVHAPFEVGGRLAVRAPWMPPPGPEVVDVVIDDRAAFGTGAHPTTRACLALLGEVEPRGGLADLGCGSGVLAIAAARLGFAPVIAVDREPDALRSAERNARANGVTVALRAGDLIEQLPQAATVAANVPHELVARLAASIERPTRRAILSGFHAAAAPQVAEAWAAGGFELRRRLDAAGWSALLLERSS